jgi:hypothetical protein
MDYSLRANLLGYNTANASGIGVFHYGNFTQKIVGTNNRDDNSPCVVNEKWFKSKWPCYHYLVRVGKYNESLLDAAIKIDMNGNIVTMYIDSADIDLAGKVKVYLSDKATCGIKWLKTGKTPGNDILFFLNVIFKTKKRYNYVLSDDQGFLRKCRILGMKTILLPDNPEFCENIPRADFKKIDYVLSCGASSAPGFTFPFERTKALKINELWRLRFDDFETTREEFEKKLFRQSKAACPAF